MIITGLQVNPLVVAVVGGAAAGICRA